MPRRSRAVVLVACALVTSLLALLPRPADSPLARLANARADGPDPRFDTPVDAAGLRRAGALLPDDATYFLFAPAGTPLLQGNLKAAAQLFLAPALPVQTPGAASWVLAYDAGTPRLPPGVTVSATHRIDRTIRLIELARAPK